MAYTYSGNSFTASGETSLAKDLAWDGSNFWVLGTGDNKVYKYNSSGVYASFSFSHSSEEHIPLSICWTGAIALIGNAHDKVFGYTTAGNHTSTADVSANVNLGTGIELVGTLLYIVNQNTREVMKFSTNGVFDSKFDISALGFTPAGIAWDGTNVWIVETASGIVTEYTTGGVATGNSFSVAGQVGTPTGITYKNGALWVMSTFSSTAFEYIQVTPGGCDYSTPILDLSPLAYYRLDESSGATAADSSGNGHDATYFNSPTLEVPSLMVGDSNAAVSFNGSTQYVRRTSTSPALNTLGDFSATFMFKAISTTTPGAIYAQAGIGSAEIDNFTYSLTLDANNTLRWHHESGVSVGHSGTFTSFTAVDGTTYHGVVTRDDTLKEYNLYINGTLLSTQSYSASPTGGTNSNFFIGKTATSSSLFHGVLDEVAIFTSVLTAQDITNLYLVSTGICSVSGSQSIWFGTGASTLQGSTMGVGDPGGIVIDPDLTGNVGTSSGNSEWWS